MKIILFLLLFLLPFLVLPFGSSQFEVPKVIAAEIGIELLLFIVLIKNSHKEFLQKKYLPLLGLFLLSCIGMVFMNTDISFFGNIFRHQGVFLLWHLLILFFLSTKIPLYKFPLWLPVALLIIELIAASMIGATVNGRSIGTLGEPNALAAVAVFFWPFALLQDSKKKYKYIFPIIAFSIAAIIIFLSGSRSGMIALGIQTVFLILVHRRKISFNISFLISCILFLTSLTIPFFTPQNPYENRVEVWKVGFWGGLERPVVGGGFGNIEKIFHKSAERINLPIKYYYVDSSHNIFLDFWLQGGIIGVGLLCFLLYQTVKNLQQQKNIVGIIHLLGLLTVMSFNPVSVVTLVAFWWLMGNSFQPSVTHKNSSA